VVPEVLKMFRIRLKQGEIVDPSAGRKQEEKGDVVGNIE